MVKLESMITGIQADLTRDILETPKDPQKYVVLLKEIKRLEEKSGFVYDLSPSYISLYLRTQKGTQII